MKKKMRTVITWGDTGRLKREEIRAVVIAIRDGTPLPEVTPIGDKKPPVRRDGPVPE